MKNPNDWEWQQMKRLSLFSHRDKNYARDEKFALSFVGIRD